MIRKIVVTMIAAIFFYLFSFLVVVSVTMQPSKDFKTCESIHNHFVRIDKIHIIYSPIFQAMHHKNTLVNTFGKIYSTVGNRNDIFVLFFLYENPGMDLNIQWPLE